MKVSIGLAIILSKIYDSADKTFIGQKLFKLFLEISETSVFASLLGKSPDSNIAVLLFGFILNQIL